MPNLENKTQLGNISIYHECIPREMAKECVDVFREYRHKGLDRDGITGGGYNPSVKESRDMNPINQFSVGDRFRSLAEEVEKHVMKCVVDYYKDNPNMLYGFGGFGLSSYEHLPPPEVILPMYMRLQHGQYQHYHTKDSSGKGGGYPANHAESVVTPEKHTPSDYRTLTWMMTLNDLPVSDTQEGYTVFTGQKIAVRPKAGQLVLFSPWLDCEHRGNRVGGVEKNIVTAWLTSEI